MLINSKIIPISSAFLMPYKTEINKFLFESLIFASTIWLSLVALRTTTIWSEIFTSNATQLNHIYTSTPYHPFSRHKNKICIKLNCLSHYPVQHFMVKSFQFLSLKQFTLWTEERLDLSRTFTLFSYRQRYIWLDLSIWTHGDIPSISTLISKKKTRITQKVCAKNLSEYSN